MSGSCLSCSGVSGPLQPCCSRSARRSRELSGERMSCTNSIKNSRPSMPTSGAPGSCWNRRSMAARTTRNRLSVCSTCLAAIGGERRRGENARNVGNIGRRSVQLAPPCLDAPNRAREQAAAHARNGRDGYRRIRVAWSDRPGRGGGSTHVGRENTKLQVAGLHPLLILLCKDRAELAAPRLGGQSIPDARHGKWARQHVVGGEVGTDRKGPRRQRR